jgi:penicillin-binding protein 1A
MGHTFRDRRLMAAARSSTAFWRRPWVGWLGLMALFGGTVGAAGLGTAWALVCRDGVCPSADSLTSYTPNQTSKLYAMDGRFIAELGLERRTLVRLDEIPDHVKDAFLVVEDKRFFDHFGIDVVRVFGAVVRNLRTRSFEEGFSTITMQLARNIFPESLTRQKTLLRKLREAHVAVDIERRYDKQRILELYLNQIYLGAGAYGVETAAQRYFGKSVREVSVAEAAMLAALPKAPERYNPRRFPDRAIQRRNTVIELMRRAAVVPSSEASLAKAFPLELAQRVEAGETAPYFVEWVRQQLDQHFGQKLYEQGLKVFTTLDVDAQAAAERALEEQLRAIESGKFGPYRHLTYEQYLARTAEGEALGGGANSPYLQGAFVAIDPRLGAVRALVGGRDYADSKFNRAVQALRQPGSTFKPLVYATAIRAGLSPAYVLDDAPLSMEQQVGPTWTPQNFDLKFEGPMPMRRALFMSRNIPAIKVGLEVGASQVVSMARRFGLSTEVPPYPSSFIGAGDVYPLEMIATYSVFANLGLRTTPYAILRVESAEGEVLWEPRPEREAVLTPEEAWLMVSMLKDVTGRGTAYNAVSGAGFRMPAGGKTGTTNDGADVWFIGFTSDLVAGVWMGFDRPTKIKANAQGGSLAAPMWTAFMQDVYKRKPAPPDWPRPDGIVAREIDAATGLLANSSCRGPILVEYFVLGTEPRLSCAEFTPSITPMSGDSLLPGGLPRGSRDTTNPFRIPPQ